MFALKPDIPTCLMVTALKDHLLFSAYGLPRLTVGRPVPHQSFFVDIIDLGPNLPVCPRFLPLNMICILQYFLNFSQLLSLHHP